MFSQIMINQIVALYEISGLNETAIVQQLDIEGGRHAVANVRSALLANSMQYVDDHSAASADGQPVVTADPAEAEYQQLKKMYEQLANNPATTDAVKEKALRWLLDESKGRNHVAKELAELKAKEVANRSDAEERLNRFRLLVESGQLSISIPAKPVLELANS